MREQEEEAGSTDPLPRLSPWDRPAWLSPAASPGVADALHCAAEARAADNWD